VSLRRSFAHAKAVLRALAVPTLFSGCADAGAGGVDDVERLWGEVAPQVAEVPQISASEAMSRRGDLVFVDVRTEAERAVSIIPGAVTAEAVEREPARFQGRQLVAYCTIGLRSGRWARTQRDRGLDVVNLRGSLLAWTFAGGPLALNGVDTRRVHTFARRWAVVAPGYEAVW
jgi:rhodanese-related sulfurtransferase